ncbi:calcium signal-modulating cyclophilin ligand-like isoform X1 [Acipenser oxyrinchus oxyrinchus]|uniref:Calcium signal-modulating cyclophilin ligand-like isoform X1 n=1 Tax=Acipenser oxyrinchus oxyrinchus TaxID=40147 RepID=A0AAD8FRE5_ACIOX|nr:calcium signal-modulating cyclophilin ligand-like isoform X1 [Acipenser oxyrinchus oxyrinchus]
MERADVITQKSSGEKSDSSAKSRAELRRRKLLVNSEDRMKRIMGFSKSDANVRNADMNMASTIPLEPVRAEQLSIPTSTRVPVFPNEADPGRQQRGAPAETRGGPRRAPRSPRRGCSSTCPADEAMKLRSQLVSEEPRQEGSSGSRSWTPSACSDWRECAAGTRCQSLVCKYLSIFAPFLTLQLAYMGLYKYFPKGEKKMKRTVLTAALLLSGIPAEVIRRSMETYSRMGDVFTDLSVYFFTFILCHEVLGLLGSESA